MHRKKAFSHTEKPQQTAYLISQDLCSPCFNKPGSPRRAEPHLVPSSAAEQILNRTQAGLASWPSKSICSCICSPVTSLTAKWEGNQRSLLFSGACREALWEGCTPVLSHREADVTSLHWNIYIQDNFSKGTMVFNNAAMS